MRVTTDFDSAIGRVAGGNLISGCTGKGAGGLCCTKARYGFVAGSVIFVLLSFERERGGDRDRDRDRDLE